MELKGQVALAVLLGMGGIAIGAIRCQRLDEAKLFDVARNGSLCHAETFLIQAFLQLFLCVDVAFCNQLKDFFMAFRFHISTIPFQVFFYSAFHNSSWNRN